MSEEEKKGSATIEADAAAAPGAAPSSKIGFPAWAVWLFAIVLMVAYALFTNKMLGFAEKKVDDINWDRALLLYRSVETLAFAAAGVLLGVQMQRAQVEQVKTELKEEKRSVAVESIEENFKTLEDLKRINKAEGTDLKDATESDVARSAVERAELAILRNLQTSINAIR
jgi:hypothetical protein